jgi:hypothetical protein
VHQVETLRAALDIVCPAIVVHGGCIDKTGKPSGADHLAHQHAVENGWWCQPLKAPWRFGAKSGPIRNAAMVAYAVALAKGLDMRIVCLRFAGGRGTASCAKIATTAGVDVVDGMDLGAVRDWVEAGAD